MTTAMNYSFHKAIYALVYDGYNILIVGGSEPRYWLTYNFEESVFNNTASIDFCYISGIDITEFLVQSANFVHNKDQFSQRLIQFIEQNQVMSVKFQKSISWYYFSGTNMGNSPRR